MTGEASSSQPLWPFALQLYAVPGVAQACLTLQNESNVDVPVLLFAAWAGVQGRGVGADQIAAVAGRMADWRQEVILPLRAIRTRLKMGPDPAPSQQTDALREAVKACELTAERVQIDVLQSLIDELPHSVDAECLRRNLRVTATHYRRSALDDAAGQAVGTICAALRG